MFYQKEHQFVNFSIRNKLVLSLNISYLVDIIIATLNITSMSQTDNKLNFKHITSIQTHESLDQDAVKNFIGQIHSKQSQKTLLQNGRWTLGEQSLYLQFIQNQKNSLVRKEERRSTKIFKMMSQFISTRGPNQCRSHHQKMQKKYDSIDNIISNCYKNLLKQTNEYQKQHDSILVFQSQKLALIPVLQEKIVPHKTVYLASEKHQTQEQKFSWTDQKYYKSGEEFQPYEINQQLYIFNPSEDLVLWENKKY